MFCDPPANTLLPPVLLLFIPPPIKLFLPLTVLLIPATIPEKPPPDKTLFVLPPTTDEYTSLVSLYLPPPMKPKVAKALLFLPPGIDEYVSFDILVAQPPTTFLTV